MRVRAMVLFLVLFVNQTAWASTAANLTLSISGMSCASCATGIKAVLGHTAGVVKSDVSYEKRRAVVVYDPAKIAPAGIVKAVAGLGYKVAIAK